MDHRRRTLRSGFGVVVALGACLVAQATVVSSAAGPSTTTVVATTTTAPTDATTTSSSPPPPTTTLPQPIPAPVGCEAAEAVVPLGALALPAIGIERPLYEGIRLPTFDLGPGHWPGSALPGQQGNMVIGGHRTSGKRDFRDLDQLEVGDEMIITDNAGMSFTYVVDSTEITGPYSFRVTCQTPASTATLFACHPPGEVTQRIVVHLTLVS